MNPKAEAYLKKVILPELEEGRPNWDKPHTESVVRYVKEIIKASPELELDPDVLVIVGYAHDWGYANLFQKGKLANYVEIAEQKKAHMVIGAEKIEALLKESVFNYLSLEQKARIVHLVSVHDKVWQLKDVDELVFMEADTLGVFDIHGVKPSFNFEDNARWEKEAFELRVTRFLTDYSKRKVLELAAERKEYYRNLKS